MTVARATDEQVQAFLKEGLVVGEDDVFFRESPVGVPQGRIEYIYAIVST